MEICGFGILLRVRELIHVRSFYRDVLGFGEPCCDSPFRCTFCTANGLTLTLVLCPGEYLEHANSAASWILPVGSVEEAEERLRKYNVSFEVCRWEGIAGTLLFAEDPEGNRFCLCQKESLS